MAESEKSVTWVIAALMVFIAAAGWGFLAGSYTGAHATPTLEMTQEEREAAYDNDRIGTIRGKARASFISNAIAQLPNMPAVIAWHFSNRIWLPILIIIAEVLAIVGGIKMKGLEKELAK